MDLLVSRLFVPSYGAVHTALHRRGPASEHSCVRCGKPALHWALQWREDGAAIIEDGEHRPFSNHVRDYAPMCVPCHKAYDGAALCRRGLHLLIEGNVMEGARRRCRACHNAAQNERRRRRALDA